ncbi:MAG TPA: alanine dehydrogenase [Flavobacteriales bacterium]|jgi:alanine dehydrogenase|nr:alanine dehydrogenase [Flavobacteriales bacterium]MBK6549703.1 alanine dehydrogenase [Flavobacteriales bacterium]MBK7102219.1 alanine dehydrogenase [Flavobacteriales bacterium]MBK7112958.1 alanine dehydrogenase [Flavobacteriales bacterium]MBK7619193.1 alanine dehydrogenase [Flavobacteriales bacterium]
MSPTSDLLRQLAREVAMAPQEQLMEVGRRKKSLFIGIPKEITFQEHRVPLTPSSVAVLVGRGHEVVIERGAGMPAQFQDNDYSEAGAMVVESPEEVFKADMILKVAPPTHNEIELLRHKQILVSALQLTVQPKDTLKRMMEKRMTAVAWDFIKDREGIYPIVRAMGEIAGTTSIQVASEYLSADKGGQGLMLGGISGVEPAEVVIIGAGTVGEFATRAALGLGASVKVFDKSIYRLRRLQSSLGQRIWTSVIQPVELRRALRSADVAIGALRPEHGRTPMVVTEEMVKEMKNGSVIVDVSIDRGGCFETSEVTTHTDPVYKRYGVVHYCVPNIASRVPRTASTALSNIFGPQMQSMGEVGGFENLIKTDIGLRHGVYLYNGSLTSAILGEAFRLPYKDLDILLAAF